jgi:CubicO group peptidase (beta-lactamase class C family)
VQKGSLVYAEGFGVADRETGRSATPDTLFQIGSVTKMFTGLLLVMLHDRGAINLDSTVQTHFPKLKLSPNEKGDSVGALTLRQIAHHTSGLPRYPENLNRVDGEPILGFSEQELNEGLLRAKLEHKPGTKWLYSNFGYGVLGETMKRATNKSYDELLSEYVFKPLKMKNSAVMLSDGQRRLLATPYRDDNPTIKTKPWDMGTMAPAGNIFSSINDLAKFMALEMGVTGNALQKRALTATHNEVWWFNAEKTSGYGIGCLIVDSKSWKTLIIWHGGDVDGYAATFMFAPKEKIGIILLTNSGIGPPMGPLGNWLMEEALMTYGG